MRASAQQIQTLFALEEPPEVEIRPHAAPTDVMPVIRSTREGIRECRTMRWGLIPHWAKDPSVARATFNARSESVFEKPTFRDPARRRRCLVPADGFIEWKEVDESRFGGLFGDDAPPRPASKKPKKQPYHIHLAGGGLFAFAGLYDRWNSPEGVLVESFTIITCPPNERMAEIHDRMPVILAEEDYDAWLDRDLQDPEALQPLLVPCPPDWIEAVPV